MITKKVFQNVDELRKVQYLAGKCDKDVGLRSEDGKVAMDAKSMLGFFAFDLKQPVVIVSESLTFHRKIENIGQTVA